jgi:hypothetical protein
VPSLDAIPLGDPFDVCESSGYPRKGCISAGKVHNFNVRGSQHDCPTWPDADEEGCVPAGPSSDAKKGKPCPLESLF